MGRCFWLLGNFATVDQVAQALKEIYVWGAPLADPVAHVQGAVTLASHILNTVDIPFGTVKESAHDGGPKDYSQWVVIKDLTNKFLYFRTYENPTLAQN